MTNYSSSLHSLSRKNKSKYAMVSSIVTIKEYDFLCSIKTYYRRMVLIACNDMEAYDSIYPVFLYNKVCVLWSKRRYLIFMHKLCFWNNLYRLRPQSTIRMLNNLNVFCSIFACTVLPLLQVQILVYIYITDYFCSFIYICDSVF